MSRHTPHLVLRLARTGQEIAQAQTLRHRVFVEELGARGGSLSDKSLGREADRFDAFCTHILLLDSLRGGAVIGTTRVMTEDGAQRAGSFASEDEFDILALRRDGRPLLEVGRTCLLPSHRGGGAMHRLWQGLAGIVAEKGIGLLFGLASFQGTDPAAVAQPLACLRRDHLAPDRLRPRCLSPIAPELAHGAEPCRRAATLAMPPLIKAYLRLGGRVGEGAFIDRSFGCIDVCMVLDTATLSARSREVYAVPPA